MLGHLLQDGLHAFADPGLHVSFDGFLKLFPPGQVLTSSLNPQLTKNYLPPNHRLAIAGFPSNPLAKELLVPDENFAQHLIRFYSDWASSMYFPEQARGGCSWLHPSERRRTARYGTHCVLLFG